MMDKVDNRIKEDYLQFNVSLKDILSAINNTKVIDNY